MFYLVLRKEQCCGLCIAINERGRVLTLHLTSGFVLFGKENQIFVYSNCLFNLVQLM